MRPGKTQFEALNSHHQGRGPGTKRSSPGQGLRGLGTPLGLAGCGSRLLQKKQRTEWGPQKLPRRGPPGAHWRAWSSSLRLHQPRSWCQLAQPCRKSIISETPDASSTPSSPGSRLWVSCFRRRGSSFRGRHRPVPERLSQRLTSRLSRGGAVVAVADLGYADPRLL